MSNSSSNVIRDNLRLANKAFAFIALGLVALTTAPFTVGPGFAWLGQQFNGLELALTYAPLVGWGVTALLALLFAYFGLRLAIILGVETPKDPPEGYRPPNKLFPSLLVVFSGAIWLTAWLATPDSNQVFPQMTALGAVPEWLATGASGLVVLTATAPLTMVVLAVIVTFLMASE